MVCKIKDKGMMFGIFFEEILQHKKKRSTYRLNPTNHFVTKVYRRSNKHVNNKS